MGVEVDEDSGVFEYLNGDQSGMNRTRVDDKRKNDLLSFANQWLNQREKDLEPKQPTAPEKRTWAANFLKKLRLAKNKSKLHAHYIVL